MTTNDRSSHHALSTSLRKRVSTAALRENALPMKSYKAATIAVEPSTKEGKPHYVKKEVRQRIRSYCCQCEEETGRSWIVKESGAYGTEITEVCLTCCHRRCLYCLFVGDDSQARFFPIQPLINILPKTPWLAFQARHLCACWNVGAIGATVGAGGSWSSSGSSGFTLLPCPMRLDVPC